MRRTAITTAMTLVLGSMASASHGKPDTPVERGHDTARRACAECHAVKPSGGASPAARAPPFASLEMRHTVGIEGRLADLTRKGHYGMPPVALTDIELADLRAYIESLHARSER